MKHVKKTVARGSLRHFKVQQVESACWLEDTTNLAQSFFSILCFEMVEHERGEDHIEAACSVFKLVRKSFIELN
jgi:hypothetical protein